MNTITQVIGLLIWFAALIVFWRAYSGRRKLPAALVWPGYVALLPLAFLFRGLFGESSLALPALIHLVANREAIRPAARLLLLTTSLLAWALEISALGLVPVDLYATGYAPCSLNDRPAPISEPLGCADRRTVTDPDRRDPGANPKPSIRMTFLAIVGQQILSRLEVIIEGLVEASCDFRIAR
jgi:hypothetical protein